MRTHTNYGSNLDAYSTRQHEDAFHPTTLAKFTKSLLKSRKHALVFVGISVASGIIGFTEMSWIYLTEGETNPVTAPLVGPIVFSALLYLKPRLEDRA